MAYRLVYSEFWTDPKVMEEMTPEDKFFYLYILTNPSTTSCGIYTITKKKMAFELGYSIESINILMERFENHHKLITYNIDTREIAIKNWGKYNLSRGGKPVLDCLSSELSKVKDKTLIQYVQKNINNEAVSALYQAFYDTSTSRERQVPRQVDNTYTERDTYTNTITSTNTERDTYTDTITSTNTERDTNTDTITSINTERDTSTDTITNTNKNIERDTFTVNGEALEQAAANNMDSAIGIGWNTQSLKNDKNNAEQASNEEAYNLSISLLKDYEKHTGHIGELNVGALKIAIIQHSYKYVKMAMDKALEKGKFSMSYINGILKAWSKEGYPEEVRSNGIRNPSKNTGITKNKFRGFKPNEPRGLTEEERRVVQSELL